MPHDPLKKFLDAVRECIPAHRLCRLELKPLFGAGAAMKPDDVKRALGPLDAAHSAALAMLHADEQRILDALRAGRLLIGEPGYAAYTNGALALRFAGLYDARNGRYTFRLMTVHETVLAYVREYLNEVPKIPALAAAHNNNPDAMFRETGELPEFWIAELDKEYAAARGLYAADTGKASLLACRDAALELTGAYHDLLCFSQGIVKQGGMSPWAAAGAKSIGERFDALYRALGDADRRLRRSLGEEAVAGALQEANARAGIWYAQIPGHEAAQTRHNLACSLAHNAFLAIDDSEEARALPDRFLATSPGLFAERLPAQARDAYFMGLARKLAALPEVPALSSEIRAEHTRAALHLDGGLPAGIVTASTPIVSAEPIRAQSRNGARSAAGWRGAKIKDWRSLTISGLDDTRITVKYGIERPVTIAFHELGLANRGKTAPTVQWDTLLELLGGRLRSEGDEARKRIQRLNAALCRFFGNATPPITNRADRGEAAQWVPLFKHAPRGPRM